MFDAFSTPRKRIWTFVFLGFCILLAIAAAAVGVSDNPPGIFLAFMSAISLILAFVHPWRSSKKFRYFFYASALGLVVFAILHILLDYIAAKYVVSGLLHHVLQGINVACFLIAVVLCPPGLLVGVIGDIVMAIRNRHKPKDDR